MNDTSTPEPSDRRPFLQQKTARAGITAIIGAVATVGIGIYALMGHELTPAQLTAIGLITGGLASGFSAATGLLGKESAIRFSTKQNKRTTQRVQNVATATVDAIQNQGGVLASRAVLEAAFKEEPKGEGALQEVDRRLGEGS